MSDDRERSRFPPRDPDEVLDEHRYSPGDRVVDNELKRADRRTGVVIECHDKRADEYVYDDEGSTVAMVNTPPYPPNDLVVSIAFASILDELYGSIWRQWPPESFTERREEHEEKVYVGKVELTDRTYAYPQSRLLDGRNLSR